MSEFWTLFALFVSLFGLTQSQDVSVPDSGAPAEGNSKQVVVQHPVTVNVAEARPMTTQPPVGPLKTRVVVVHNNMVPVPIECFQPPDSGTCSKDLARIYYDHETRTCKPFSYTGCGGNANRFQSIKNCYRICHPYRYKIRPKVTSNKNRGQLNTNRALKVRMLPAQQATQGNRGGGGGGPGGRMAAGPQFPGAYPPSRFQQQQQQFGYFPPPQYGFGGQRPAYGYGSSPGNQNIIQKELVRNGENGIQLKHSPIGETSGLKDQSPNNAGRIQLN